MISEKKVKKILILNLGGIGDVLLSTPALRALKNHFEGAHIVFLGVPRVCDLVRSFSFIDEVISFSGYEESKRKFGINHFAGIWRLLMELRRRHFDIAINMRTIVSWRSSLKIAFIFLGIGAKRSVGRNTDGKGFFFDIKIPEKWPGNEHEMDYDLETAQLLGADVSDNSLQWSVSNSAREMIKNLLLKEDIEPDARLIGFHIGGIATRRWPYLYFSDVIRELSAQGLRCAIVGGGSDILLSAQIKKEAGSALVDMVGKLSLDELAAFIERCDVFITTDSGPMHIAAILQKPLVAIFGGGSLERYDPRRVNKNSVVLSSKAGCIPCHRLECRDLKCLKSIKPVDVLKAIFFFLKTSDEKCNLKHERLSVVERFYRWFRDLTSKPQERKECSAGFWQSKIRENALDICSKLSGQFLEVGCGEGLFLSSVAQANLGLKLWGVDNWPRILIRAQELFKKFNVSGIHLVEAQAQKLPFINGSFDGVACINVFINIGSISDVEAIISEMSRICKKGGSLVIEFRNSLNPFIRIKYKLAKYYDSTVKEKFLNTYTLRDIEAILGKYNCVIKQKRCLEFPIKALAPTIILEAIKQ